MRAFINAPCLIIQPIVPYFCSSLTSLSLLSHSSPPPPRLEASAAEAQEAARAKVRASLDEKLTELRSIKHELVDSEDDGLVVTESALSEMSDD